MSTTKTDPIMQDLATLRARRGDLQAELDEARAELRRVQDAAIDGDSSGSAITEAQSTVSGLKGTIALLDERIAETERLAETARTEAELDELKAKLRSTSEQALRARERFEAAHEEARSAILAAAASAQEADTEWSAANRDFLAAFEQAEKMGVSRAELLATLDDAGASTEAVLSDRFDRVRYGYAPRSHVYQPMELGFAGDVAVNAIRAARVGLDRKAHLDAQRGPEPQRTA